MLYGVYKLNGQEYEMKTASIITSPSEPAKFDRVDLNRSAHTCSMSFTRKVGLNVFSHTYLESIRMPRSSSPKTSPLTRLPSPLRAAGKVTTARASWTSVQVTLFSTWEATPPTSL